KEDNAHFLVLSGTGKKVLFRSELRKAMLDVNAPLTIILTDCCSDLHSKVALARFSPPSPPKGVPKLLPAFRQLFFEERGVVDVTAAMTGDFAWSARDGSIFTSAFCKILVKEKDNQELTWRRFYQKIKEETEKGYDVFKEAEKKAAEDANLPLDPLLKKQIVQTPMVFRMPGVTIGLILKDDDPDEPKRVLVHEVQRDSRAEKAGFQREDTITAIEGKTFRD